MTEKKSSQLSYWRAIAEQRKADEKRAAHAAVNTNSAKHAADYGSQRSRRQTAASSTNVSKVSGGTPLHEALRSPARPRDTYTTDVEPLASRFSSDTMPEFSMPKTSKAKDPAVPVRTIVLCAAAAVAVLVIAGKILSVVFNQGYSYSVSAAMISSVIDEGAQEIEAGASSVLAAVDERLADLSTEERLERVRTIEVQRADIEALSGQEDLFAFVLGSETSSEVLDVSDEAKQSIEEALGALPDDTTIGYLFVDIASGRGFAANIDANIYGASTFKAFFAAYILEKKVDTKEVELSSIRRLMQLTVVESDNDAYIALRERFASDDGFSEYLFSIGVSPDLASEDYPTYSVRESTELWLYLYDYLQSDTQGAQFLKTMLENTSTSFIRAELPTSETKVLSKAGWIESDTSEYNSTSDAGIVTVGDRDYLLSLMSDVPCTEENSFLVQDVILAIYQARDTLV